MTASLPAIDIRRLDANDAESFSALRREVTAMNPVGMGISLEEESQRSLEGFRAQLSFPHPNAVFGAFCAGELVAAAAVTRVNPFTSSWHKMLMWGVFTSPRYRRRGFSRAVVNAAIRHSSESGVRRIVLWVHVPNEPALALYRSLGFEECGKEPEAVQVDGTFYDAVQMSLAVERHTTAPAPSA